MCRIVAQPSFSRDYARRVDVIAVERDRQTGRNISPHGGTMAGLIRRGRKKIRRNNDRPSLPRKRAKSAFLFNFHFTKDRNRAPAKLSLSPPAASPKPFQIDALFRRPHFLLQPFLAAWPGFNGRRRRRRRRKTLSSLILQRQSIYTVYILGLRERKREGGRENGSSTRLNMQGVCRVPRRTTSLALIAVMLTAHGHFAPPNLCRPRKA